MGSKKERFIITKLMTVEPPMMFITNYDSYKRADMTELVIRITVKTSDLDKIEEMWYNTKHE